MDVKNNIESIEENVSRDHWLNEVQALDLLNGVNEENAASLSSVADRFLIFDKPLVSES